MLRYDSPSPITVDSFLADCRSSMDDRAYRLMECALQGRAGDNRFLRDYQHFCRMVKCELSEQRAHKLSLSGDTYKNNEEKSYVVADAVRLALSNDNVLEAEMSLIILQWKHLDEMAEGHVFDIEGLLAYALKLGLITRKNLFVKEQGNSEFCRLFSNLQSEIKSKVVE
jgi:hypothetical protein